MSASASERKRAEEEHERLVEQLEAQRRRLEAVVQQMPAGVIIAEAPSGRLILGSEQVERIWRHPMLPSAGVGEYREWQGFYPDGRPYAPEEWPLARSVRTGEVVTDEEVDILRGDGTRGAISLSSAPIRDREGRIVAGVVVFTDISERKRAEEERERLLAELDASIASLPDGLIIYGPEAEVIRMNAAAQSILGYSARERGASLEERTAPLRIETAEGRPFPTQEAPVLRALRGETVVGVILRVHRPDGQSFWLSTSAAPIRHPDGRLLGAVATFTDITDLRRLQEQTSQLYEAERAARAQAEAAIPSSPASNGATPVCLSRLCGRRSPAGRKTRSARPFTT